MEAQACYEARTPQLCQFLENCVFSRYGIPEVIITDQGRQFCSLKTDEFCQKFGITQLFSAAYHQQANAAERRIQEFKNVMKVLDNGKAIKSWDDNIPKALQILRCRKNRSNKQTPAFLLLSRKLELPRPKEWDTLYAEQRRNLTISQRRGNLKQASKQIRDFQLKNYHNSEEPYIRFSPGDLVNVRSRPSAGRPFQSAWTGPHEIISLEGDTTYKVLINEVECLVHLNDIRKAPEGNFIDDSDSIDSTSSESDLSDFDFPSENNRSPSDYEENNIDE